MPITLNGEMIGPVASLGGLTDVDLTGLLVGQGISWNGVDWVPTSFSLVGHTHTLSDITDAGTAAAAASTDFVAVTGDEMTGDLTFASNVDLELGVNGRVLSLLNTSQTAAWVRTRIVSDAADRFFMEVGGQMNWGGGTSGADVTLERIAASTLGLGAGDQIQVQQDPVVDNDLARKKYVDDGLAGKSSTGHTHTLSEITDAGTAAASAATDFVAVTGDDMTGALTTTSTVTVNQGLGTTREIQIGKVFGGNVLIDFGNNLSAYIRKGAGNTLVTGPGAWLIEGPGGGALQLTNTAFGTGFYIGGDIAAGLKRSAAGVLQTTGKIQSTQAPTVGDDLTNKTYVDSVAGTNRIARSFTATEASTSDEVNYTQAATLSTGVVAAGDYMLSVAFMSTASSNDRSPETRVQVDDADIGFTMNVNMRESGEYHHGYLRRQITLTAASHNIDVDFRKMQGAGTVYMKDIEIILEKI